MTFDDENKTSLQNLPSAFRPIPPKMTAKIDDHPWDEDTGKNDANEALRVARTQPPKTEK